MQTCQNSITLCIPRLVITTSKEYIIETIDKMNIGTIERLQEIPIQNSPNFKRIIINIKWDLHTEQSQFIYSRLSENKSIKIVHDMPWYWICVKYTKQTTSTTYTHKINQSLAESFRDSIIL